MEGKGKGAKLLKLINDEGNIKYMWAQQQQA
jgi:hypothetical protein